MRRMFQLFTGLREQYHIILQYLENGIVLRESLHLGGNLFQVNTADLNRLKPSHAN
jgi:hypothetical protein